MPENEVPTPIPTLSHAEVARQAIERIRQALEVTGSTTLTDTAEHRRLNPLARVTDEMLERAAASLDTYPSLAATSEFTSAQIRDVIALSLAYRSIVDEFRLATRKLVQRITTIRAEVGEQALKIYGVAKQLNRPAQKAMLVPHVVAMRQAMGRRGPGRKTLPPPADGTPPANGTPPAAPAIPTPAKPGEPTKQP